MPNTIQGAELIDPRWVTPGNNDEGQNYLELLIQERPDVDLLLTNGHVGKVIDGKVTDTGETFHDPFEEGGDPIGNFLVNAATIVAAVWMGGGIAAEVIGGAGAAEGVTGAGLTWEAEVASALESGAFSEVAGTSALGSSVDAELATYLLDGGASFIATGLEGGAIDASSFLDVIEEDIVSEVTELTGAGAAESVSQTLPEATSNIVAPTAPAAPTAGAWDAAATWMSPAEGAGSALTKTATPWYESALNWVGKHPGPAAIGAQSVLGAVGAIGAASAKEKEIEILANAPERKRQADEAAMAGAGQKQHVKATGNLMPEAWNNAGIVPRDPVTGLPLGVKYPMAGGLINRRT